MLGVKIRKLSFSKNYTLEELQQALETQDWGEIGAPQLVKHGFAEVIAFPPIDRQNQIWVQVMKPKGSDKGQVFLSHDVAGDFGNMAKNMLLDHLTDGLAGMGAAFGKKAKLGEKQVEEIAEKITAMNL